MKMRIAFFLGCVLTATCFAEPADPQNDPVVATVQKVMPAVVNLSTEHLVQREFGDPFEELFRQFFGGTRPHRFNGGVSQSLGSGVVVDEDGWIITNFHVVQRATKIHVVMADGTKYEAKQISGDDKNDLALLKIESPKPMSFVEISDQREPLLGETVIAVGNPFGLEHTVTKGIISAKRRKYEAGDVVFNDILQTDAAINPGNSGGPLVNLRGQLVGINMAILSQAQGIGFAIPGKRVAEMLAAWLTPEKRSHLWLGLKFAHRDNDIVVTDAQPASPAGKAGVVAGDVVMALDGEKFGNILRLQRSLLHKQAGDVIRLDVRRAGVAKSFTVTLVALPKLSVPELMRQKFGIDVQEMNADLAAAFGVPATQGLLVANVEKGSPAAEAGLRRGLVITQIAGDDIPPAEQLAERLTDLKKGDTLQVGVLLAERRGNMLIRQNAAAVLKAR